MDDFIFGAVDVVCGAIRGVGADQLWLDLCATGRGRGFLYYAVIGFLIAVSLSILAALGSALPKEKHREGRDR